MKLLARSMVSGRKEKKRSFSEVVNAILGIYPMKCNDLKRICIQSTFAARRAARWDAYMEMLDGSKLSCSTCAVQWNKS